MTMKTNEPSYQLTFEDAVEIHTLLWDGWLQRRIAAKYDVNGFGLVKFPQATWR